MKNILDFIRFEEKNKEINFRLISEIGENIHNDLNETEKSLLKGSKIINPLLKKYVDKVEAGELSLFKNYLSTKIEKIDNDYFYNIEGTLFRFKTIFRLVSWYDIILNHNPYVVRNLKNGFLKELKGFIQLILLNHINDLNSSKEEFLKNHYDIRGGILLDEKLNEVMEESIKVFQPYFSFSFNNLIQEEDEFVVINPSMPLSKFSKRALEIKDRFNDQSKLVKFMVEKYYQLFNSGERCTIISPFKNISPDLSMEQSSIRESIIVHDRAFRDEDLFFEIFKDKSRYEYFYDYLDKVVEYEISINGITVKSYFIISNNPKDKVYFIRIQDSRYSLVLDVSDSLSSLSGIFEYIASDSERSELAYMISDKKDEKKKEEKQSKTRVYAEPHITYVRGFWRKSKYGVLHHVRPSKRFYGDPEFKNKKIRTLIVLK